jgi:hypothetical protein
MTTTGTTMIQPAAAETAEDRIRHVKLSTLTLPLDTPISGLFTVECGAPLRQWVYAARRAALVSRIRAW